MVIKMKKKRENEEATETTIFESPKKFKKESGNANKSFQKKDGGTKLSKDRNGNTSKKSENGIVSKKDKEGGKSKNSKVISSFKKPKQFPKKGSEKKDPEELNKKESRLKQKLLRNKRREKERGYAIPDEAKKLFEEMRCKKCPAERRTELAERLFNLLSERISSAVRSHDLTRMIQWLIKVGPPNVKQKVIDHVIVDTIELSKAKYSNHIILRILKDCSKPTRKAVFNYFIGNIAVLMRNRFSSLVVEEYYSKHAKSKEKAFMRQELYSDFFKGGRDPTLTSLSVVLSQNPTLTSAILNSTKVMLSKLIDKKSSLSTNLVCDVLNEYLQHCQEQDKLDLLELLKSNISLLLNKKSGSKVVMHLLWESTAKVKKAIVKELKAHVLKIAKSSGNIFIRSLFDSVDDTVLIKKAILPTLLDNAEDLVKDSNGRKVILYLVAHRDSAYFHPKELEELKKADESASVKKDISVKEKELLEPCVGCLLLKLKENPDFWFSEPNIAVVAFAILKKGSGDVLYETNRVVAEYMARNMAEENSKVESAGVHMILKKLIKEDAIPDEEKKFSFQLASHLNPELVENIIKSNRGCFILVHLIESNIESICNKIKHIFKKGKLQKKLDSLDYKGAEILKNLLAKK